MVVESQIIREERGKNILDNNRFRVVAPLFITCPVCSVTVEGDGGKGGVREKRLRERTRHTDRGWPVNSRAEEKTFVLFFLPLDWGPL